MRGEADLQATNAKLDEEIRKCTNVTLRAEREAQKRESERLRANAEIPKLRSELNDAFKTLAAVPPPAPPGLGSNPPEA